MRRKWEPVRRGSHDWFQPIRSQFTKDHMTVSQSDASMRSCDAPLPWKHQGTVPIWLSWKKPKWGGNEEELATSQKGSHDWFQPTSSQFTKGHKTVSQSDVSMRSCDAPLPWKHQVMVPIWLSLKIAKMWWNWKQVWRGSYDWFQPIRRQFTKITCSFDSVPYNLYDIISA